MQASWEPFDWGRKRSELAQKQKSTREAEVALKDLEDKIRIEVGSAYRNMEEARVKLAPGRAARFRVNAALLKDVLGAQSDMAAADDKAVRALADYWSARAEREAAMGEQQ